MAVASGFDHGHHLRDWRDIRDNRRNVPLDCIQVDQQSGAPARDAPDHLLHALQGVISGHQEFRSVPLEDAGDP
jgi:hypothetical protein